MLIVVEFKSKYDLSGGLKYLSAYGGAHLSTLSDYNVKRFPRKTLRWNVTEFSTVTLNNKCFKFRNIMCGKLHSTHLTIQFYT